MILRYRTGIQDAWLLLGIVAIAFIIAFEFDFRGDMPSSKRLEFEETLALGATITLGVIYFAYRRMNEQGREIRRRILAEERARELAETDALTGLPNRRRFYDTLKKTIALPRDAKEMHAVLALDLNGFKKVNDLYGHATGDRVLIAVAERFVSAVRECDVLARLGGDEFAVIVHHIDGPRSVVAIAKRIMEGLEKPIEIESVSHRLGVAIGIALAPQDGTAPELVLNKADAALYRAKAEGRSAAWFFAGGISESL